ncbi:MAG: deoxyribodipyrimidine photolyase [Woeseia sp.]|nr:deoxyribodipyrimidine photolyase [Woeseia sp.]|tara:strand:+ start:3962 stop:5359 length:1398 start_codon:yes stop_codon:yes gene_type:complete
MNKTNPAIIWFRQDLRVNDNQAFNAAVESGMPILPVYVLDNENAGEWALGIASRCWLIQSLTALNKSLEGHLRFFKGPADQIIPKLANEVNASGVYWGRCYEPWRIHRDQYIKTTLHQNNIQAKSFNNSLLFEPNRILKPDGTPYKVFTPFFRNGCLQATQQTDLTVKTASVRVFDQSPVGEDINELDFSLDSNLQAAVQNNWQPGELGALNQFNRFLDHGIQGYKEGRNFPGTDHVSRLSPHLHFGEISIRQVWHSIKNETEADREDIEHFLSELCWREFSYNLLYHRPEMPRKNLQEKFDKFPWRDNKKDFNKWRLGETGYPIVDAGMRELRQTGYMHNRVRMIVGSFLVKNMLLHWHHGKDWFWDSLFDADLANNSASWQWIAGCGADSMPYFRIFNPITQGRKFDPQGVYIRRHIPELAKIPAEHIHMPWVAGTKINYPTPILDLASTRKRALKALGSTRN